MRYNPQMAGRHWLSGYIDDIGEKRAAGGNTEASYRTPIERMMEKAAAEFCADVDITHEPERTKDLGAPDFLISAKGGGVVGYVECKKPGADLHKETTKAQVEKYRALSENILLTDSFRWMHFRDGKITADILLTSKPDKRKREEFAEVLRRFMMTPPEKVADSERLAKDLALRCAILREGLEMHENNEQSQLHGLLDAFRKALDRDLDFRRFADIFAQTIVYSLLMAKLNAPDGAQLELDTARRHIPENFAIIREMTMFLTKLEDRAFADIRWVVGDILVIINGMDRVAIAESMSYKKGVIDGNDPYINFYEDFLAKYDAKLRKSRGVYYTPSQVVRFIVRAADDLLRRDFNMPKGLAEKGRVTVLDFAAGTGTFMLEMARLLFGSSKSPARIDILARGHFLQNFYGFELMASAYVISHLKLSRFLSAHGVKLQDERIKVYLANTLERINEQMELGLMPALADEVKSAEEVKKSKVLVIVGNPPYSRVSQNKSDEKYKRKHKKIKDKWVEDTRHTWIGGLLRGFDDDKNVGGSYYEVDGNPLGEINPQALQDDYVKFIRFAQHKMDKEEHGIVAIITNHAFLDNPTFRGMRQSLMKTFDALYFLDLHGNSKKQEKAPDGGKDENVFDIQQGVAVSLLVKNPAAKKKGVFHADMWGLQKHKYADCEESNVNWAAIKPASPHYFFVPYNSEGGDKFRQHWSMPEIFSVQGSGIKSHRDHFAFDFCADVIKARVRDLASEKIALDDLREKYNLKDTRDWKLQQARTMLIKHSFDKFLKPCMYRPFDARWCYYGREIMELPRPEVMSQMLAGENIGLTTVRQVKAGKTWQHCFVAAMPVECTLVSNKTSEVNYLFPLYAYESEMGVIEKRENFTTEFREWIDANYGMKHSAEDILGCIYAVMHSPNYRNCYGDFLRRDFPRIPFPKNNDEFKRLAAIGNELIAAHLLRTNCHGEYGELCGDGTSHKMENVRYDENAARLYFNRDEYFRIPPEVFNFQIGGYKPLDKYLKSRKGRQLSPDEVDTIEKATNAIAYTIAKMREIDG